MLHVEQAALSGVGTMAEQILSIIEALLQGGGASMKLMIAAGQEEESQLEMLLEIIKTPYVVLLCTFFALLLFNIDSYYPRKSGLSSLH